MIQLEFLYMQDHAEALNNVPLSEREPQQVDQCHPNHYQIGSGYSHVSVYSAESCRLEYPGEAASSAGVGPSPAARAEISFDARSSC